MAKKQKKKYLYIHPPSDLTDLELFCKELLSIIINWDCWSACCALQVLAENVVKNDNKDIKTLAISFPFIVITFYFLLFHHLKSQ